MKHADSFFFFLLPFSQGLLVALGSMDSVVSTIRTARDAGEASRQLQSSKGTCSLAQRTFYPFLSFYNIRGGGESSQTIFHIFEVQDSVRSDFGLFYSLSQFQSYLQCRIQSTPHSLRPHPLQHAQKKYTYNQTPHTQPHPKPKRQIANLSTPKPNTQNPTPQTQHKSDQHSRSSNHIFPFLLPVSSSFLFQFSFCLPPNPTPSFRCPCVA